jgi:hypothetical protein
METVLKDKLLVEIQQYITSRTTLEAYVRQLQKNQIMND